MRKNSGRAGNARRRHFVARFGVGFIAVALLAGACESKSSSSRSSRLHDKEDPVVSTDSGSGLNSDPVNSGQSPSPAPRPLRAEDFLLTAGTETRGFREEPAEPTAEPSTLFEDNVIECTGTNPGRVGPAPTDSADGPSFVDDISGTTLRSFASVYDSSQTVAAHREIVRGDLFAGCYGRALVDALDSPDSGATLLGTESLTPPPGATDRIRIRLDMFTEDDSFEMYVDLVLVYTGRVESTIVVVNPYEPADDELLGELTYQVERKVANQ